MDDLGFATASASPGCTGTSVGRLKWWCAETIAHAYDGIIKCIGSETRYRTDSTVGGESVLETRRGRS